MDFLSQNLIHLFALSIHAAKLRKRDRVKKVVKNVLGMNKETAEIMDTSEGEEPPAQQNAPVRRKMLKAKSGEKYAKIDCIEEKAYQILKDLDMIEEYN